VEFTKNYLFLISLITLFLGGFLVLAPNQVINLFFNDQTVATEFFARITGSTLVGYSTLNYLASKSNMAKLAGIAVYGNLSTLAAAAVITITYISRFDSFGWLIISQHLFFASGFVICLYKLSSK